MWQNRIFVISGCLAGIILTFTAVRSAIGLSTSEKPTPLGHFDIPAFAELIECDAHFSHQILRIKNHMPAQNDAADLTLMHRNYRRLHRLMRQVGRRDGINPADQTNRLRARDQAQSRKRRNRRRRTRRKMQGYGGHAHCPPTVQPTHRRPLTSQAPTEPISELKR